MLDQNQTVSFRRHLTFVRRRDFVFGLFPILGTKPLIFTFVVPAIPVVVMCVLNNSGTFFHFGLILQSKCGLI